MRKDGQNARKGTFKLKAGLAQMLKGGVIMDVTTPEQAKIAQEAGACAVMALERVPADIRKAGGVARMADPGIVRRIMEAVSIPVMAKARIGHVVEARILEALGVDYIDESEVLTPADDRFHIDKKPFRNFAHVYCKSAVRPGKFHYNLKKKTEVVKPFYGFYFGLSFLGDV